MTEHVPLTEEKISSMPMGEVFQLVADMQTKCNETMQDLQTINDFLSKNTGVIHRG